MHFQENRKFGPGNLAQKIKKVKVYENEDDFVSEFQALVWL